MAPTNVFIGLVGLSIFVQQTENPPFPLHCCSHWYCVYSDCTYFSNHLITTNYLLIYKLK
jgi:hypothetical protein